MPTDKYCNYENAPYTMSDNLHMSRYTYGQIGNGIANYMIRNEILDRRKSMADKDKLMTYIPFSKLETHSDSKVKDAPSADNNKEKMLDGTQHKVVNHNFREILGTGIKEQLQFLELRN